MSDAAPTGHQTLIGVGVLVVAGVIAFGAIDIPATSGYQGVGPNFLPWVVAVLLAICGVWLVADARRGGWRDVEPPSGGARGDWRSFTWVSAGVLANAALITTIGFALACALCFVMAVRGLRISEGRPGGDLRRTLTDVAIGVLISLPVYWLFTKLLAINLPGLTGSGWI